MQGKGVAGISGANGFIGSHLAEALLAEGYSVRALVRKSSDLKWLKGLDIELVYGELSDPESLGDFTRDLDWMVHAAAITAHPDPEHVYKANVEGTRNLVRALSANAKSLKKLVFISSQEGAGLNQGDDPRDESMPDAPLTVYGKSKIMAEKLLEEEFPHLPWTILRPGPVFGPRETDFAMIFKLASLRIKPVACFPARISMVYVADLVQAILCAFDPARGLGKKYYIASTGSLSWNDAIELLFRNFPRPFIYIPLLKFLIWLVTRIASTAAAIFRFRTILNQEKYLMLTASNLAVDTSLARKDLGFIPATGLEEGFRITTRWYREHGWI